MDDIVRAALAKWPNVPACYGWLMLDRRGAWRMRDEAAQRAQSLGSPVRHAALIAFIVRNYDVDEHGRWYFQNGPQRVYLELEYTPYVVRLARDADTARDALTLTDQTDASWEPVACWTDDRGAVLFSGHAHGDARARIAVLHDHDLDLFADRLDGDAGRHPDHASPPLQFVWRRDRILPIATIRAEDVAAQFGFVASPAALAAHDAHR
ncbi:DUF2946 family protein [Pararobbsia silviterrae]|uniref:DUF2946 family protein n=1 Tax=Pararobbsia silviterrae TaxID=1792498 RepID=A0A494YG24_9BURK|nr:DUF2946 family protein [Pararobbsia silviterrae]RKP58987.1 DUF2946 family protein [Pararobbsia silviterrae]